MVRATEQQISELGGQLGLAPAAGPRAGAAAAAAVRDPAGQAAPVEGLLARHEAAPAGESGASAQQAQRQDVVQPPQEQRELGQPAEGPKAQQGQGQACEAGSRQAVPLLATSGSERAMLKRDRSKVYCQPNKRQELAGQEAAPPHQPPSSASSLPASCGGERSTGQGPAAAPARQPPASGGTTPLGGSPMAASPVVGSPLAPPARRPSIMQRTRAALQLWKSLRVGGGGRAAGVSLVSVPWGGSAMRALKCVAVGMMAGGAGLKRCTLKCPADFWPPVPPRCRSPTHPPLPRCLASRSSSSSSSSSSRCLPPDASAARRDLTHAPSHSNPSPCFVFSPFSTFWAPSPGPSSISTSSLLPATRSATV
jgi:hypothetical protein